MCGRSLARRPRALDRSFGSCPNTPLDVRVLSCSPAAAGPTRHLQPLCSREGVRAERTPNVRPPLVDRHHETVIGQRVAVGIGQKKSARGRGIDERQDWDAAAVGQRPGLRSILTTHLGPADEVITTFPDIRHRDRQLTADLPIDTDGILVGIRSANRLIEHELGLGIDDRDDVRVPAGRRNETRSGDRAHAIVEGSEFSGQDALRESAVTGTQHRLAVRSEFPRDTQAR